MEWIVVRMEAKREKTYMAGAFVGDGHLKQFCCTMFHPHQFRGSGWCGEQRGYGSSRRFFAK
jgi:hypothetical protein